MSHVIHTVGPIYNRSNPGESRELLRSAYRASASLAAARGLRRIAFPAVSCGVFGFPLETAAVVALEALQEASAGGDGGDGPSGGLEEVHFVLYDEDARCAPLIFIPVAR